MFSHDVARIVSGPEKSDSCWMQQQSWMLRLTTGYFTVKILKIRTPKKCALITLKFEQGLYHRVVRPKDADGIANSVAPDQTVPPEEVWLLIRVFTVCLDMPVWKLRIMTVSSIHSEMSERQEKTEPERYPHVVVLSPVRVLMIWATTWQNQQNDVCPAETQISLGIRPVWSESLHCPHEETLGP